MQHDGRYMMRTNFRCSKNLLDACFKQGTRLIYASSGAVYGGGAHFAEVPRNERPLNVYGYSKLVFDQVVRRYLPQPAQQVVGLRYFNVYCPREQHKARMASVAFHHFNQFRADGFVRLFGEYGGYGPGMHQRDFVSVDDVVAVNLWFLDHAHCSGIFNVGTGRAQPFNDVAVAVVNGCRAMHDMQPLPQEQIVAEGLLRYVCRSPSLWSASINATPRPIWVPCEASAAISSSQTWRPGSSATCAGWGSKHVTAFRDAVVPS